MDSISRFSRRMKFLKYFLGSFLFMCNSQIASLLCKTLASIASTSSLWSPRVLLTYSLVAKICANIEIILLASLTGLCRRHLCRSSTCWRYRCCRTSSRCDVVVDMTDLHVCHDFGCRKASRHRHHRSVGGFCQRCCGSRRLEGDHKSDFYRCG